MIVDLDFIESSLWTLENYVKDDLGRVCHNVSELARLRHYSQELKNCRVDLAVYIAKNGGKL